MDDTWNLPAGHLLNGRYRILRALDQNVYLAEDPTLNRPVLITEYVPRGAYRTETLAVGRLPRDEASYQKGLDDFLRSGTLLANCIELAPAVPPVLDVFQANATGYIAEAYIEGVSLEQIMREEGPIPAERMVSWLEPAIRSLAEIHRMGFFHRTIAPDCFLRSSDGAVWLTGLHRDASRVWLDSAEEKRELPDRKTVYAPFEAFTSREWRASGDVYGLCAVMYDCLTGQRPVHILDRVDGPGAAFPDRSLLEKALTPRQAGAVIKGLSVQPTDRWQSVGEFWSALCGADMEGAQMGGYEDSAMYQGLPADTLLCGRYRILRGLDPDENMYLAEDVMLNRPVVITEYRPHGAQRNEDLSISAFCSRDVLRNAKTEGQRALGKMAEAAEPSFAGVFQAAKAEFLRCGKRLAGVTEGANASAPILDVFEANHTGYIVEKYVEGVSLKKLVKDGGQISMEALAQKLEPVIRDLGMMHQAGAYHGSITPDRLIQAPDGKIWLTGIHPARRFLTPSAITAGSAEPFLRSPYLPAEAFICDPQAWRAALDVYSLCATIHYCLTGSDIPCALSRDNDDICGSWKLSLCGGMRIAKNYEEALEKGLAMWPTDRWPSMEAFYEALYAPERPHTGGNRQDDETRHTDETQPGDRKPPSALRKFLCKGRGPKQISVLHILTAVLIMGGALAGLIWLNRPEPLTPEQERRAMLMEMGGFRLGDLSYTFIAPDLPVLLVSGYVGTDTEVTIPEEANGFPVTGIGIFALKESGLKTVYLPDSITYDPIGFPEGCTVVGGQPEEAGGSSLEQQLEEAAKAAEAE